MPHLPIQTPEKPKRHYIVEEIIATERTYVSGLEGLLEEFDKPLARTLKPEETRTIFSNIHLLLGMHRVLLQNMEKKWASDQCIGHEISELIPFLRMYTAYINAFDQTNELIERLKKKNNDFRLLLPTCKHGIHEGDLGLASLLLTPIQRIPRYVLLLNDLLRNTNEDHPDHVHITAACAAMQQIATLVNEAKRKDEQSKRIAGLSSELAKALHNSPHSWFRHKTERDLTCEVCKLQIGSFSKCYSCEICGQNVHVGCHGKEGNCGDEEESSSLVKHNRMYIREGSAFHRKITIDQDGVSTGKFAKEVKEKKECLIFLFNDSLLVVYPERKKETGSSSSAAKGSEEQSYKLCAMIHWYSGTTKREVRFERLPPNEKTGFRPTTMDIYPPREFSFHTLIWNDPNELDSWWDAITEAQRQWKTRQENGIVIPGGSSISLGTLSSTPSSPSGSSPHSTSSSDMSGSISSASSSSASSSASSASSSSSSSVAGHSGSSDGKMFTIPATAPVPGTGGKFTAYVIMINEPGKESRSILKRYSQLLDLHLALKKLGIPKKNLPQFPKKKWFGNTDPKFVKKRREKLQAYLNGLQPNILALPLVKRFLTTGVDEAVSPDDIPSEDFFENSTIEGQVIETAISSDDEKDTDLGANAEEAVHEPLLCLAIGLFDFVPEDSNELAFRQSDVLEIYRKDGDGWWYAVNRSTGLAGDVPATYVREQT